MLVLEVDADDTPQRRIGLKVGFQGMVEMGSIKKGVECILVMVFKGSLMEAMGVDGDINR